MKTFSGNILIKQKVKKETTPPKNWNSAFAYLTDYLYLLQNRKKKIVVFINADKYTVVNESLIPTGELRDVTGTLMDFKKPTTIGSRINEVEGGYDHNYVLNNKGGFAKVTELYDPVSGRIVEVFTSEPGIQFYSGNFLDGSITGKKDMVYRKHFGLCLETQHFPDSPNRPDFPNTILRPGEEYKLTFLT